LLKLEALIMRDPTAAPVIRGGAGLCAFHMSEPVVTPTAVRMAAPAPGAFRLSVPHW
jgi:hypothetical protein